MRDLPYGGRTGPTTGLREEIDVEGNGGTSEQARAGSRMSRRSCDVDGTGSGSGSWVVPVAVVVDVVMVAVVGGEMADIGSWTLCSSMDGRYLALLSRRPVLKADVYLPVITHDNLERA